MFYLLFASQITAYWEVTTRENPLFPTKALSLSHISTKANYISIASTVPLPGDHGRLWSFDPDIYRYYSEPELEQAVQEVNQRKNGQSVLFSVSYHKNWADEINIPAFVKSLAEAVKEWNLGGIDLDSDSSVEIDAFVQLIEELRKALPSGKIISFTTASYGDLPIIAKTKESLHWVNTMIYGACLADHIEFFDACAKAIGDPSKVSIGVKAGGKDSTDFTDLETVRRCAMAACQKGSSRMMLWTAPRDVHPITGSPDGTWLDTLYETLRTYRPPEVPGITPIKMKSFRLWLRSLGQCVHSEAWKKGDTQANSNPLVANIMPVN